MNAHDLARLRAGNAECPSDLALDRLHAGELSQAESQQLSAHVAACTTCPQRMAERRAGFEALPEVDPRPLLSAIRRRLHEKESEPAARKWLRQLTLLFAPMAAATAALLVFMWVRHGEPEQPLVKTPGTSGAADPEPDVIRLKGSLGLHVYRLRDGRKEGAQAAISGDQFAPGDRLRFVVDLPSSGQIAIVGVESDGDLYTAWPSPAELTESARPAGRGQELPGAVALDQSPGQETLYLVHCPQASAPPHCASMGAQGPPQCGAGCSLVSFVINKNKGS